VEKNKDLVDYFQKQQPQQLNYLQ